jgi:hypothetical protein
MLQFLARLVFVASAVVLLLALLAVGLVLGLVWWLVALLTGGRRPQARVWVDRAQHQARAWATRGAPQPAGEVVEAEVREIR